MIDDNLQLIFVENSKAASFSIMMALIGEDFLDHPTDPRFATINHNTPDIIKSRYSKQWATYYSFVVVRNTWDRAHSFFVYYQKYGVAESYRKMTFDQWVARECPPPEDDHLRSIMRGEGRLDDVLDQTRYVRGVNEVIVLHSFNAIARFRELSSGLERVARKINIGPLKLPVCNHQHRSGESIKWSSNTVNMLSELYAEEIVMFSFQPPETG